MKKQLTILLMTASLTVSALSGCSNSTSNESSAQETTSAVTETESTAQAETEHSEESETPAETVTDETLAAILSAVKDAYGDNYIPNSTLDAQMLEDVVGLTPDLYESCFAEAPMISTFVETFIGIKASQGNADQAEQVLNEYRERLVADTMQYPMNIAKIQASQVVRHEDYIFFVMLGAPDDAAMEEGDEAALASAAENNQIAISEIEKHFQ